MAGVTDLCLWYLYSGKIHSGVFSSHERIQQDWLVGKSTANLRNYQDSPRPPSSYWLYSWMGQPMSLVFLYKTHGGGSEIYLQISSEQILCKASILNYYSWMLRQIYVCGIFIVAKYRNTNCKLFAKVFQANPKQGFSFEL